jgi:hypothetical protein
MLPRGATIVWVFQLIFPMIGLAHVGIWLYHGFNLGRFDLLLLYLCGLWCCGILVALALPRTRRWIARYPAQLVALYLCTGAGLTAAEVACRPMPLPYDPRLPHITRFSPELGWRPIAGARDIGEHGWRRPSYLHEKSPDHFRIVCLGDSNTFGTGCSWKDAWPHQLESLATKEADWSKSHGITEALNLGFHSYGPDQALLVLKEFGLSYSPDVVIFHLCIDDFADSSFDHDWKMNYGTTRYKPFYVLQQGTLVSGRDRVPLPRDALGNVLDDSDVSAGTVQLYLFSFLRSKGGSLFCEEPRKKIPEPTKAHWPIHDNFRAEYLRARPLVWALIKEMSRVSCETGARFLVTLSPCHMVSASDNPPWRIGRFLREYEEDARAAGLSARHCIPSYFAEGGNDRFLLPEGFLNPEGNALIARATLHWLREGYARADRARLVPPVP